MKQGRHPCVGDMIIKTCRKSGEKWVGLIHEIEPNRYAHTYAYITWSDSKGPSDYHPHAGYSGINIHNLRQEYDVIRGGVSIP